VAFSQEKIFETMFKAPQENKNKFNDTWCDLLTP